MRSALPVALALLLGLGSVHTSAQVLLKVDARAEVAAPRTGHIQMGTVRSPQGQTLGADSQALRRNGQPWLPVMAEYHYSRAPASQWQTQLHLLKASGIDIVASYVFWNHHEEQDGRFDWTGRRDLRRFVQQARAAGLKVVVRIGPWAHGEARYGGIPDWVVDAMPTRRNDPQYLRHVERFYQRIGEQLRGLYWKDGGPVIAVQLENEYNLTGPGQGEAHISTLKRLALKAGMDVPLYTVTGWDGAVYPSGEVVPVLGGYADAPWARHTNEMPPRETYAFRFGSRVTGDLGAQTRAQRRGTAETDTDQVPFLGAEYGGGLPAMYRRRTLVSPDDITAMLPVQIGSGVNLLGYYMFHGGRNPVRVGGPALEESSLSGGYNDTPRINYDFQAPLGPDGQQRPVLGQLRPWHYFLAEHGPRLAVMTPRPPERTPVAHTELQTPRWSVRSRGDSGFLFFNHHVRLHPLPPLQGVQFELQLPGGSITLPMRPVDIADGAHFMWPFNMDLDGVLLRHATAMPVTRVDAGELGIVHVFMQTPGMDAEFALPDGVRTLPAGTGRLLPIGHTPSAGAGRPRVVSVMLLSPAEAAQLQVLDLAGRRRLVFSEQQAWVEQGRLHLRGPATQELQAAVFPALPRPRAAGLQSRMDGVLQRLSLPAIGQEMALDIHATRAAGTAPRILTGGLAGAALQPIPEAFAAAAGWTLKLPAAWPRGVDEVLLEIDFVGDIGRVFSGTRMLDDWYYNGQPWQLGLQAVGVKPGEALALAVLPLRADAPIYLEAAHRPRWAPGQDQVAELRTARLLPLRRVRIAP